MSQTMNEPAAEQAQTSDALKITNYWIIVYSFCVSSVKSILLI